MGAKNINALKLINYFKYHFKVYLKALFDLSTSMIFFLHAY